MSSTVLIIAAACDGDDFGADGCALLGNVVLTDVLGSDESCEGREEGEPLEEHCECCVLC